jgi:hypothetical protein
MPIILSDLLWSAEDEADATRLPTVGPDYAQHLPAGQKDKPRELGQKMYIIAGKICLVFAGLNGEIRTFLRVFKETFQNKGVTISRENIDRFLKAYELEHHFKASGFFITYIENRPGGSVKVNQFYSPGETNQVDPQQFNFVDGLWNSMEDPVYESTAAFGSGAKGFLQLIKQPVRFESRFPEGDFMRAVQTNTALIAKLLALERVSLYTIRENWGGGFEMAYYNGRKFDKVDNIAYVISHSQFNEAGDIGLPIPMLIMYYRYVKDILYITALEAHKYQIEETETHIRFTSASGEFMTTIFEVPGIDLENIDAIPMPADFSFSTDRIAMGYSLALPDRTPFNPSFFNLGPAVSVTFQQKKSLEVLLHRQIAADVRQAAMGQYPNL